MSTSYTEIGPALNARHLHAVAKASRYVSMKSVEQADRAHAVEFTGREGFVANVFETVMQLDEPAEPVDVVSSMFDDIMQLDAAELQWAEPLCLVMI